MKDILLSAFFLFFIFPPIPGFISASIIMGCIIFLAFKYKDSTKFLAIVSPILTCILLLFLTIFASAAYNVPWKLWTLHIDYLLKMILAGIVYGIVTYLSIKLWGWQNFAYQFIRQSISSMVMLFGWIFLGILNTYTISLCMGLAVGH